MTNMQKTTPSDSDTEWQIIKNYHENPDCIGSPF